jgi:RNA polymerase sigma-70 factor (ECF subfamily)
MAMRSEFGQPGKPEESAATAARSDSAADLRLLEKIKHGDLDAFQCLYLDYQPRLTRFLMSLVHHPQLVEEVLDDTLLVVWDKAASFKGESKLSTWIFAIAYRKAMKALRKHDLPLEDMQAQSRLSEDPGPDEDWAQKRVHALLRSAMTRLSPQHRAVVDLTYFHDLGYREVAEILKCPVDTVKTRMFYARRYLRESLEGELDDWL